MLKYLIVLMQVGKASDICAAQVLQDPDPAHVTLPAMADPNIDYTITAVLR